MDQKSQLPQALSEHELHPPLPVRGLHVLLAEDDNEMRNFMCAELRAAGHTVSTMHDGTSMIQALSQMSKLPCNTPDAIIMDVRMPGYSGLHILAALRAAQWSTPVVLITAFGDSRVHEEGTRLGAVVFDKPFDIDDLRAVLLNLKRSHKRAAGGDNERTSRGRDDEPG